MIFHNWALFASGFQKLLDPPPVPSNQRLASPVTMIEEAVAQMHCCVFKEGVQKGKSELERWRGFLKASCKESPRPESVTGGGAEFPS